VKNTSHYRLWWTGKYSGQDLRKARAHLAQRGLNDAHFDAVAGHLQAALEDLNVPVDLISEVMTLVGTTRNDVLGR
jgi:hemoglobin